MLKNNMMSALGDRAAPDVGAARTVVLTGDARLFSSLALPRYAECLNGLPPGYIAVGGIMAGRPAALALGFLDDNGTAELLSLAVAGGHRGKGAGRCILRAWEEEASARGATHATARFAGSVPVRAAVEGLAAAAGWSPPREDGLFVVGRAGVMADVVGQWPAISQRLAIPSAYEYAPVELTPEDLPRIEYFLSLPEAADMQGPVGLADKLALDFSLFIRRGGELVGWVLAGPSDRAAISRLYGSDAPAIEYYEAFLDPAYWHTAVAVGAYYRCYKAQADQLGHGSVAIYYTHPKRPRMVHLTRRRFAPIADRVETVFSSGKLLSAPHSPPTERNPS